MVSIGCSQLPIDRGQAIRSIFKRTTTQLAAAIYGIPAILYAAPVGFDLVDMAGRQILHDMFLAMLVINGTSRLSTCNAANGASH
jgi:hypothetical protein